jgi:hypothetical protein
MRPPTGGDIRNCTIYKAHVVEIVGKLSSQQGISAPIAGGKEK